MPRRKNAQITGPDGWEVEVGIALKQCCISLSEVIERKDPSDAALITAMAHAAKGLGELMITQKVLEFEQPPIQVEINQVHSRPKPE